jgi:hypothetical protein
MQTLLRGHVPQIGLLDSDVYCPAQIKDLNVSLTKMLAQHVTIESSRATPNNAQSKDDTSEDIYIEFSKGADQIGLLSFSTTAEGCLYLESLSVPYLDGSE